MITVKNITKNFKLYNRPADRLKEIILRRSYHKNFIALKDINFKVNSGETLGIVGRNGAGKSTLLKIMTGILIPDSGTVEISGKITGLLELGTGFNPEFSGIDNIFFNATFLGLSPQETADRLERIIEFTELGPFINEPLKTYSSGMIMRLAFSVAINADPLVFVVDEALSVGDAYFQQKCMRRIRKFKEEGGSIVFVSHDMNAVKVLCDKAILLDHGEILDYGDPEEIINRYNWLVSKSCDNSGLIREDAERPDSHGTFEGRITNVAIIGSNSASNVIVAGEEGLITVTIRSEVSLTSLTSGILIRDRFGQDIFGTNTMMNGLELTMDKGENYQITYRMKMNIGPGKYTVSAALQMDPLREARRLHWIDRGGEFEIISSAAGNFTGLCKLDPRIEINPVN
jgi:lipopolysaccharide transport system ATP-binding protein